MVTTLALSPGPFFASVLGDENETKEESALPLVALADQTTKTTAVLACPGLHVPRSTSSSQSSLKTTVNAPYNSWSSSGDDAGGDDEGTSGAVGQMRLLSVQRCHDKVVSLVASPEASMLRGFDEKRVGDEESGVNTEQHPQPHPHIHPPHPQQDQMKRQRTQTNRMPYRRSSWETGRGEFVACTASGAVWEFGLGAPVRLSGV